MDIVWVAEPFEQVDYVVLFMKFLLLVSGSCLFLNNVLCITSSIGMLNLYYNSSYMLFWMQNPDPDYNTVYLCYIWTPFTALRHFLVTNSRSSVILHLVLASFIGYQSFGSIHALSR